MKRYYKFLLTAIAAIAAVCATAQADTVNRKGMDFMKQQLGLTDAQAQKITQLTADHVKAMKSAASAPLHPDVRKKQMEDRHDAYRKAVRKILTPAQWDQYAAIEARRRRATLDSMAVRTGTRIVPGVIKN